MPKTTADKTSLKHPKFAPLTLDYCLNPDAPDERIYRIAEFCSNVYQDVVVFSIFDKVLG